MRNSFLPLVVCLACCVVTGANAAEEVAPAPVPSGYRWVSDNVVLRAADSLSLDTLGARLAISPREAVPFDSGLAMVPVLIRESAPVYPEAAREAGVKRDMWVQALVGSDGHVRMARIVKTDDTTGSSALGFERSALTAAMQMVYKPAMRNDQPVETWVTYNVTFKLRDIKGSQEEPRVVPSTRPTH
jgi:TonB family protein